MLALVRLVYGFGGRVLHVGCEAVELTMERIKPVAKNKCFIR
jgi:hypothetical protein